jgi:hypothetical protein
MSRPEIQAEEITPDMLILEILSACRQTEAVFRKYEGEAGDCLLCHSLFDSLEEAAAKYRLPLQQLLADLKAVAATKEETRA